MQNHLVMNTAVNNNVLESMSSDEIMAVGQQGVYILLGRMQKQLEIMEDNRVKDNNRSGIAIDEVKNIASKAVDIAVSAKAIKSNMAGYMNAADFGAMFINKIGAKRVGDLFRIIGVAKRSSKKTIPYHTCVPKYAKIDFQPDVYGNDHPTYRWNYDTCKDRLDNWLQKHGHYEDFYVSSTKGVLDKYIKDMYDRFICGEFDDNCA